ncbi:MAG: esterase-like activity of phytase family protein [Pseudolabrys sp.]
MSLLRGRPLVAGVLLLVLAAVVAFAAPRYATAPVRIVIDATPITSFDDRDPSRVRFGDLEFRGGLALESKHPAFGGISGLHVEPGGNRFIAVTDKGSWLRGRIIYRNGRPTGIADAEMAPVLGSDGRPLAARGWYDTESLAERDGVLYVGIERVEQIVRFDYRRDGLLARGQPISVPADFKTLTYNKSLECVAAPQQGSLAGELIAVSEHSLDGAGNLRSFLIGADHVTRFSIKRTEDFDVSDCTIIPPDDLLLLERRFSIVRGIGMRMRRVPLSSLKEGAVLDGRSMIEADLGYQIDNMEGISIHRTAGGETIITVVSDDNFSVLQRSLLLQFAVVGR